MRFTGAASRSGMMHDSICCRVHLQREQTGQLSAIIGAVDVFVTGDKDFSGVRIGSPSIITPAEFVSVFL